MFKKLVLIFVVLALAVAVAGTAPGAGGNYKITLLKNSLVQGNELKAGECRLNLSGDKVTIVQGKEKFELAAKIETAEQKFDTTAIRYTDQGGKTSIMEIRLGGTKTRLVFNP